MNINGIRGLTLAVGLGSVFRVRIAMAGVRLRVAVRAFASVLKNWLNMPENSLNLSTKNS